MKLRLVRFSLGPGKRKAAEKVAGTVVPLIRKQKGCERCEFFGDNETGDYGFVVIWSSEKAAEAAAEVVGPVMSKAMAEAKSVPDIRLFDVFEPMMKWPGFVIGLAGFLMRRDDLQPKKVSDAQTIGCLHLCC